MDINKAVITAAAPEQKTLPLQTLVDRDGRQRSALQVLLGEVHSAGVQEVALVICGGEESAYREAAGEYRDRLHFVVQEEAGGYGHALFCTRDFIGRDPFLHLVSDHLYISHHNSSCAAQLVQVAQAQKCAVSAVESTREYRLPYYGAVGGTREQQHEGLYRIQCVLEKPTPTEAEQRLLVPGLRAGHYLCFFGMHVLTPTVFSILEEKLQPGTEDARPSLSVALYDLAGRERYLAYEIEGRRHNIGVKYGLLIAQLALALEGKEREQVLAELLELLALRDLSHRSS